MSETKQHPNKFQDDFDSGEPITVSITRTETECLITTDESTTVLSCTETLEDRDYSNEVLNVTGVTAYYNTGVNSNQNYLVIEQMSSASAQSKTERQQTTPRPSGETNDKETNESDRQEDTNTPVGWFGRTVN